MILVHTEPRKEGFRDFGIFVEFDRFHLYLGQVLSIDSFFSLISFLGLIEFAASTDVSLFSGFYGFSCMRLGTGKTGLVSMMFRWF